ncbi:MAG: polysaccharide deacetylase family protein [Myxococcales bacterium]|nr:polysaccharide deacetylase family protein [Myxococcota bacterium]MDW8283184.1 polysaccharide deacetylase family protein [Myxococcales bacterium]
MEVCITIDVEQDCPPYLDSYRGIEEGMPQLMALLREEGVPATFFTTGDVARRYPAVVRRIVAEGHELGAHGDTHRRFSELDAAQARAELEAASATLRAFAPVVSFRAPNLDLPACVLPLLRQHGYRIDSSQGRHKHGLYFRRPRVHREAGLWRVPASLPPSVLRAPGPLPNLLCALCESPFVPFYHPWDFVDLRGAPIPLDCRLRSGEAALRHLRRTIRWLRRRGARFLRLADLSFPD